MYSVLYLVHCALATPTNSPGASSIAATGFVSARVYPERSIAHSPPGASTSVQDETTSLAPPSSFDSQSSQLFATISMNKDNTHRALCSEPHDDRVLLPVGRAALTLRAGAPAAVGLPIQAFSAAKNLSPKLEEAATALSQAPTPLLCSKSSAFAAVVGRDLAHLSWV